MKLQIALALCSLSLAWAPLTQVTPPAPGPKGTVIAVGGGGTTPEIIERALQAAGGKSARVLIAAQASSDPKAGEESRTFWMEHGATDVHVLDLSDREAALKEIRAAAFIWMPGGVQTTLYDALAKADVVTAIVDRFRAGAVVGGTSAGCAILSKCMIIGGDQADLKNVRAGGTQTTDGLGVAPDVIFDQHFLQRQRFNRLLACVLDHPEQVGVGIDEKTAVVMSGTAFEVIGESSVFVVDARAAVRTPPQSGEKHSARDVKLHVLTRGDKFDLAPKTK